MSFRAALSGLNAANTDLSVTGNNIANASTVGFKGSRAEFVDVYAASYQGISRLQAGAGTRVAQIQQQMNEGNVEYTDNNLDMAIAGKGFFTLEDEAGGTKYARAGQFFPDDEGYVTNSQRQRLQVYPPNDDGTFNTGQLTDLRLKGGEGEPSATENSEIDLNLNADDEAIDPEVYPDFDPDEPATYNYSTSQTVYDSLGAKHEMTMYFRKTDTNEWDVYTRMADGDGFAGAQSSPYEAGDGTVNGPHSLSFNSDGSLESIDGEPPTENLTLGWSIDNGAEGNNGEPIPGEFEFDIDFTGATQYANESGVSELSQDGYATGMLTGIDIDDQGVAFANFTNGEARPLGKVALATFSNPQGLQPIGDSTWQETSDSGDARLGEPGTSDLGLIQSGAIEASNVELAEELVSLITAQRNYQANSQTIKTMDTVTQTLINMR